MADANTTPARCGHTVYHRDTYRLRRGYGMRLHYTLDQCSRNAGADGFCWQHSPSRPLVMPWQRKK